MSIQAFLRGYKLPYTSSFFTSTPLTLISVNSKINSKILSICVNMLKLAHAPTHLLSFTIFLVYIHCLYIDKWSNSMYIFNNLYHHFSSFFTSNEFTLLRIDSKVDLRSVHKIWPLSGPKDINKYVLLWKCFTMDKRDPRTPQDAGDMWRSTMDRTTLFSICTKPF